MGVSSAGGPLGRSALACLVSASIACGSGTPAQPSTSSGPGAVADPWTLRGRVVEALSDTPIAGAKLAVSLSSGSREVVTGPDGSWELSQAAGDATAPVDVSAEGYVTRRAYIRWNGGSRDGVVLDLIKVAAPFSLAYYRELVRNQFDEPGVLQTLRRWTKNPNFYIHTRDPITGAEIPSSEYELLVATIRAAVPQVTGGRLSAAVIDRGADRREQAGYVTVTFVHDEDADYCGRARVGADPGLITLNYRSSRCAPACGSFPLRTVAHEVGHAMGFWHVSEGAVLTTTWYARDCGLTSYSAIERHHAAIAYTRTPGNQDEDRDPPSGALLQAPAPAPPVVTCR